MQIIYETHGKANEYAPLAAELFTGCRYACKYCYVPSAVGLDSKLFHNRVIPVDHVLHHLEKDASQMHHHADSREILLCFTCDPYPQDISLQNITSTALHILKQKRLTFTVLTKSGLRAVRDFHILAGYPNASFGTTLIFTDPNDSKFWEPFAAPIDSRVQAIRKAHESGIRTWVSIEPVIDPRQAIQLVIHLNDIVDHWKIGKLNYHPNIEKNVDWIEFREEMKTCLDKLGASYYLKKSLTRLN